MFETKFWRLEDDEEMGKRWDEAQVGLEVLKDYYGNVRLFDLCVYTFRINMLPRQTHDRLHVFDCFDSHIS